MKTLQYKNEEGQWVTIPMIGGTTQEPDIVYIELTNYIDKGTIKNSDDYDKIQDAIINKKQIIFYYQTTVVNINSYSYYPVISSYATISTNGTFYLKVLDQSTNMIRIYKIKISPDNFQVEKMPINVDWDAEEDNLKTKLEELNFNPLLVEVNNMPSSSNFALVKEEDYENIYNAALTNRQIIFYCKPNSILSYTFYTISANVASTTIQLRIYGTNGKKYILTINSNNKTLTCIENTIDANSISGYSIDFKTQSGYESLEPKDPQTLYFIIEEEG